jgi:hypothetical protein
MKITPAVKHIMTVLSTGLKRFPLTILFSTAVAVMLIIINELQPLTDTNLAETLNRVILILALGIPYPYASSSFGKGRTMRNYLHLSVYTVQAV